MKNLPFLALVIFALFVGWVVLHPAPICQTEVDLAVEEEPVSPGDFYAIKPGEVIRLEGYCLGNDDPDQCSEHAVFVACLENESRLLINATVWPNLGEYQLDVAHLLLSEEIITTKKVSDGEAYQVVQTLLGEGLVDEILRDFGMVDTDPEPPLLDKSKGF